ncbi:hypothetical protein HN51_039918 [Arachis hypogaea]
MLALCLFSALSAITVLGSTITTIRDWSLKIVEKIDSTVFCCTKSMQWWGTCCWLHRVYGEEQKKCSNKIDLTLKLSSCGDEKEEERRRKLKRSLSVIKDGSIT